jgi:hypothetical protein
MLVNQMLMQTVKKITSLLLNRDIQMDKWPGAYLRVERLKGSSLW